MCAARRTPFTPRLAARVAYLVHGAVKPNGFYWRIATILGKHRSIASAFTRSERVTKEKLFGCQMCGQCALPATGYACPMSCPKQLRNGPCGGVSGTGQCEVFPDQRCVWVVAFERAAQAGHGRDMDLLQRPVDHRLTGSSSWLNYWQGRDEGLWIQPSDRLPHPPLRRELPLVQR